MSMHSVIRYAWLVYTIRRHGKVTLAQIQDDWRHSIYNEDFSELPRRTFALHKDAVENLFGIEIKVNGYNQYYIDENVKGDDFRGILMYSFSLSNLFQMMPSLRQRVLFEPVPTGHEYMLKIVEAMKMSQKMHITCRNFGEEKAVEYECAPLALKMYNRRWYLIAQIESQQIRSFALDELEKFVILSDTFLMPKDFNAERYFHEIVGVKNSPEVKKQKVIFRTNKYVADIIKSRPIHNTQKELKSADGYFCFEISVKPNEELKQELMMYMNGLEIMEPQSFREDFKQTVAAMLDKYKER